MNHNNDQQAQKPKAAVAGCMHLRSKQQLPNWTWDLFNKGEVLPCTGNLANQPRASEAMDLGEKPTTTATLNHQLLTTL